MPPERPGERKKQRDAQAELLVGAPAIGERAPASPPQMPAPSGDNPGLAAQHDSASGGSAVRSGERPDSFSVGTEDTAAPNAFQELTLESAQEPAEKPESPPSSDSTQEPTPAWRKRTVLAALAATILVAGLSILVIGREVIESAVSSLSVMVGLEAAPGAGLDISAVTSFREETADGEVLVVEGTVTNATADARPLPAIRVTLFNTEDAELQHVMVVPDQQVLVPGARIAFSARLEQPAPTARRIKVSFTAQREPT